MTVRFDTPKFARTLRDGGGFTPAQAEGLSDAIADAMAGDIADLTAELKGDIADLRTDMKGLEAKIEAARSDTIRGVVGLVGFQTITIIGAAVVLARYLGG